MLDLVRGLDARTSAMIAQLDMQIGEFGARGWAFSAAKAEDLICTIYQEAGEDVPSGRAIRGEALLSMAADRQSSH